MNFEFSQDQQLLREMIRDFVHKEIRPKAKSLEKEQQFPLEVLKKLSNLGILGMTVPAEYGGIKTDYLSFILTLEELAKISPSLAVIINVHCSLFCYSIYKFGTEKQKKKYLPPATKGELLGAFSVSEPGAGSDATNLKTKAVKKDDFYLLNGTKAWVTNGQNAEAFIILAKSEIQPGAHKLNAFIVEKNFPGIKISKIEEKMGLNSSVTAEIVLEDCQVPAENLLGPEGKGATVAFHCLDGSRIGIAAQAVGLGSQALEEAVKYSQQREAFNQKISEFQAIQFMIADMSTQLEAARLLTYKAADLVDKGKPFGKEAAMAKLLATEAANKIAYQALQIHGGYGYSKEFFIEQLYRDARVLTIYEGTSEIQRLIISRYLLQEN